MRLVLMLAPVAQVPKGLVFVTCIAFIPAMIETDLLLFSLDGSAWSLHPRDGLYATSGNLS